MSLDDADRVGAPENPMASGAPGNSELAAPLEPIMSVRLTNTAPHEALLSDDLPTNEVEDHSGESATLLAPGRRAPLPPPGLPAFPGMSSVPTVAPLPTQETPALRITRPLRPSQRLTHPLSPQRARSGFPRKRAVTTKPQAHTSMIAPALLRWSRLLAGLALLGLAWGGAVGVATLGSAIVDALKGQTHPVLQLALVAAYGVGALWLAIMSGACVLVGAFALRLWLIEPGW